MHIKSFGLTNCTVAELIEMLKQVDPECVVCLTTWEDYEKYSHSTLEIMNEYIDEEYTDDSGNEIKGKIISFF